ncbi:MAG: alginate lyase family protein [Bacteroidota bacterium]
MKRIYLLAALAFFAGSVKAQFVSLNKAELDKLKQLCSTDASAKARFAELEKAADAALGATPNPIDTIHTEGRLQGDPQKTATQAAFRDMNKMYSLALIYRTSGDKKYLNKAVEFLAAWSQKNIPNGDPIDDTNLDPVVEAYDFIKADIDATNNKLITAWLAQTAQMEINKMKKGRETSFNNWHSHRLKEVGEIGFAINDKKYIDFAVDGIKEQIGRNLLPDGSSIDFKLRDALHYHTYDLEPLTKLAIIIKRATGVDFYNYESPEQTSLKKSTDWLVPFISGAKTHGEFVNSTVAFDKKRAANGEKGYIAGTLFEPRNGIGALLLAEYFFPDAINLIQKVKGTQENYPDWQLVLNKVKR